CSDGYLLKGEAPAAQILPKPVAEIAAQARLATSHLLWSGVWYGIAVNAMGRAQNCVRAAARKNPGATPPGALRLAEASSLLQLLKSNIIAGLAEFEAARDDQDRLSSMGFAVAMNNIKVGSSETI